MYPYQTLQGMGANQQQALGNYAGFTGQGQQLALTPIQQYLAYLGQGNTANQVQNQGVGVANSIAQTGLNQANLGFNQNQTLGSNIGAGLSGLTNQNNWNWLNSASGTAGSPGGMVAPSFAFGGG